MLPYSGIISTYPPNLFFIRLLSPLSPRRNALPLDGIKKYQQVTMYNFLTLYFLEVPTRCTFEGVILPCFNSLVKTSSFSKLPFTKYLVPL